MGTGWREVSLVGILPPFLDSVDEYAAKVKSGDVDVSRGFRASPESNPGTDLGTNAPD